MDKSIAKDKRRKDKCHKKLPKVKAREATQKATKSVVTTSEPLVVCDDRYSKRPIESNWPLPEEVSSDESDDHQSRAANFEELLRLPHSVSGHFFLSTEKHWIREASEPVITTGKSNEQFANHFKIDTKHLNACFSTIPFYERNEYPPEIFVDSEIKCMKLKAECETKKYQNLCYKLESNKKMSDSHRTPPAKCLVGSDALPLSLSSENDVSVSTPPQQPAPCLLGPMALPPEFRNDPHVTGSYTSATQPGTSTLVVDQTVKTNNAETTKANSSKEITEPSVTKNSDPAPGETKEAIQQWLDDILDM